MVLVFAFAFALALGSGSSLVSKCRRSLRAWESSSGADGERETRSSTRAHSANSSLSGGSIAAAALCTSTNSLTSAGTRQAGLALAVSADHAPSIKKRSCADCATSLRSASRHRCAPAAAAADKRRSSWRTGRRAAATAPELPADEVAAKLAMAAAAVPEALVMVLVAKQAEEEAAEAAAAVEAEAELGATATEVGVAKERVVEGVLPLATLCSSLSHPMRVNEVSVLAGCGVEEAEEAEEMAGALEELAEAAAVEAAELEHAGVTKASGLRRSSDVASEVARGSLSAAPKARSHGSKCWSSGAGGGGWARGRPRGGRWRPCRGRPRAAWRGAGAARPSASARLRASGRACAPVAVREAAGRPRRHPGGEAPERGAGQVAAQNASRLPRRRRTSATCPTRC
eukprot:5074927-Pleurochrysis_carterae.AAC.1